MNPTHYQGAGWGSNHLRRVFHQHKVSFANSRLPPLLPPLPSLSCLLLLVFTTENMDNLKQTGKSKVERSLFRSFCSIPNYPISTRAASHSSQSLGKAPLLSLKQHYFLCKRHCPTNLLPRIGPCVFFEG